jgi:hypothetical protein
MIVGGLSFLLQLVMTSRSSRRGPGAEREHLYNGDNPPPAL